MKINEVFEGLLKNKDSVYEAKMGNYRSELSLCESGFFYLKTYDNQGKEIDSSLGGGEFSGNIMATDEWELVRQEVDFMTAVNSGKCIKSFKNARFHDIGWFFTCGLTLEEINGKWLIE